MFNRGLHSITYVFAVSLIPAWASLYLKTDKLAHSTSSIAAMRWTVVVLYLALSQLHQRLSSVWVGLTMLAAMSLSNACDAFFPASNLGPHEQSAIVMVAVHKRDNVYIRAELITGGSQPC